MWQQQNGSNYNMEQSIGSPGRGASLYPQAFSTQYNAPGPMSPMMQSQKR